MKLVRLYASPFTLVSAIVLTLLLCAACSTPASARLSSKPDDFPVGVELRAPGSETPYISYVTDIELSSDGKVAYVIGTFNRAFDKNGTHSRPGFVAIDLVNKQVLPQTVDLLGPNIVGEPFVIKRAGEWLYIGGGLTVVNGHPAHALVRVDASSAQPDFGFDLYTKGFVNSIEFGPSSKPSKLPELFVGGYFDSVAGPQGLVPASRLAAVDPDTGQQTRALPQVDGVFVSALRVVGDTLHVGGRFTEVARNPRNNLAAISLSSGQTLPWAPDTDDDVRVLAAAPRRPELLGGGYQSMLGSPPITSGAFGSVGSGATNLTAPGFSSAANQRRWPNTLDGAVLDIAATSSEVVAAGAFYNNARRRLATASRNLASFDARSALGTSWRPDPDIGVWRLPTHGRCTNSLPAAT